MWIRRLNRYLAKIHIYPQYRYTLQRKHHFPWTLQIDLRKNNMCNIKYHLLLQQFFLSLDLKCFGNISAWECNNLDLSLHLVLYQYFRKNLSTTKYLRGDPLCFQAPISSHTISFTFLKLEFDIEKVTLLDTSMCCYLHKYSSSYDPSDILTISSHWYGCVLHGGAGKYISPL